jgi:hypothetical protein
MMINKSLGIKERDRAMRIGWVIGIDTCIMDSGEDFWSGVILWEKT